MLHGFMRNESISFFFDRTICQGGKNEAIDVLILRRLSIQSYMLFSLGKYSVDNICMEQMSLLGLVLLNIFMSDLEDEAVDLQVTPADRKCQHFGGLY